MAENDLAMSLGKLLENPEALAGVMQMASTLIGNMPAADTGDPPAQTTVDAPQEDGSAENNTGSAPELAAALPAIAGILNDTKANDPRCTLLYALKPYMSHGRAERIDMIVRALKLAKAASGLIGSGGLF